MAALLRWGKSAARTEALLQESRKVSQSDFQVGTSAMSVSQITTMIKQTTPPRQKKKSV